MFKDFKLDKYINKKPPSDNSVTTRNEINKINKKIGTKAIREIRFI